MRSLARSTPLIVLLTVLLAACGGAAQAPPQASSGETTGAPAAPAASTEQVTLRYFTWADATDKPKIDKILEDYTQANPNVQVTHETVAGSGAAVYPDVLKTSMASGDPPDVFWMWGGSIAKPFIDSGQVLDLQPYYEKYGWDKILAPWTIERVTIDGKKWGVPRNALGMGFFYRKDLFEQNGLQVPKTYAELEQVCQTLKSKDIYCASVGGKFGWHTMRILDYFLEKTCGPEMHDKLNRLEESWESACVVEAYGLMNKWVEQGWLVPDFLTVAPTDARLPVYQGKAAMVLEGPWFENVLKSDEQDTKNFDFFLPPTDHQPLRYSAFPEQFMIPKDAKNPDAAAEFINWWINPDTQKKYLDVIGRTSATAGIAPDCNEWPLTCKWREIIGTSKDTYPPTDQAFVKELMDSFFEVQDGMIAGQLTPEAGAKLMQQRAADWQAKNK